MEIWDLPANLLIDQADETRNFRAAGHTTRGITPNQAFNPARQFLTVFETA